MNTSLSSRLRFSLLALRVGVFIVLFIWTIDKFINPDHAAAVFSTFYAIDGLSAIVSYVIGAIQLAVIVAFLTGFKKLFSYGAVLVMQLVPTLASFSAYLDPWTGSNILFFAAWPMFAATIALFLLRNEDTLLSLGDGDVAFRGTEQPVTTNAD